MSMTELAGRAAAAWRVHAERWLLAGAACALAACLLNPGWPVERARFDHVVVLDITQSMNVQDESLDGKPASRLAYAKQALRQALCSCRAGPGSAGGVFTEYRSFLLFEPVEVCANLSELRSTLAHVDGSMAWSGNSEIAKGLHSAIGVAKQLPGSPSLVFVTDGHEAPPLSPQHRPSFDDKPGDVAGVIVGVGGLRPSPIPKSDPAGRPLGFWQADEVAQSDLYSSGRGASVSGERMTEDGAAAASPALGATPGSEHLSALREPYLRLLGREQGLAFVRLESPEALAATLTAPALAKPTQVRADGRIGFAWLAHRLAAGAIRDNADAQARHDACARGAAVHRTDRPVVRRARRAGCLGQRPAVPGGSHGRARRRRAGLVVRVVGAAAGQRARAVDRAGVHLRRRHLAAIRTHPLHRSARRRNRSRGRARVQAPVQQRRARRLGLGRERVARRRAHTRRRQRPFGRHQAAVVDRTGRWRRLPASRRGSRQGARCAARLVRRRGHRARAVQAHPVLRRTGARGPVDVRADRGPPLAARDKLAIDVSLQQQRADGARASGFIVGLGWYDL
jgi:mxaL protein